MSSCCDPRGCEANESSCRTVGTRSFGKHLVQEPANERLQLARHAEASALGPHSRASVLVGCLAVDCSVIRPLVRSAALSLSAGVSERGVRNISKPLPHFEGRLHVLLTGLNEILS